MTKTTVVKVKELTGPAAVEAQRQIRAKNLLNLQIEQNDLTKDIDIEKAWFREQANNNTLTVVVDGVGQVQVRKGAEASSGTSYGFNTTAYQSLPKAKQNELIRLGVVSVTPFHKAAGTPSVVVTPNK